MGFYNNFINYLKTKISGLVDLCNISGQHLSDDKVGSYILYIKRTEPFAYCTMGYRYEKQDGELRFIIYAFQPDKSQIRFFKDRCPAMIERDIINTKFIPFKLVERKDLMYKSYNEVVSI